MPAEVMRHWLESRHLSQEEGARMLGIKMRTISSYVRGEAPIPRYIAMAVWAADHGYPPP